MMGSPEKERQGIKYETPYHSIWREGTRHRVTLSKGFWLTIHPVTQACWDKIAQWNPSSHKGANLPVEVSWALCITFLHVLSEREGHTYRLPTEAEWEYACRAGTTTPFYFVQTISTDQANYDGRSPYGGGKKGKFRKKTTPVGSFPQNAWGLYDMHGNIREWVRDWAGGKYPRGEIVDPQGPPKGETRVLRGGGFGYPAWLIRSAVRDWINPSLPSPTIGFRVLLREHSPRPTGSDSSCS
jgi:formylglycine-generating enzyme required for sulfatase activity